MIHAVRPARKHMALLNKDIVWRLAEWHQRRALFDITPIGSPAYTLTRLEVMAGQFYMAVVVAQLVGLKLAQALKGGRLEAN